MTYACVWHAQGSERSELPLQPLFKQKCPFLLQVLELSGNGKQTNKKAENWVVMSRRSKEYHRSSTGGALVDPPPHACQQGAATRMAAAIFVPDHLPILSHPDRYTSAEGAKAQRCWGIYSVQLSGCRSRPVFPNENAISKMCKLTY